MIFRRRAKNVVVVLPSFYQTEDYLFSHLFSDEYSEKFPYKVKYKQKLSAESLLYQLLTKDNDLKIPFAAISAIGNGLSAQKGWWLQVDPVELLVDAGNICLIGRDHLELQEQESRHFLASLNNMLKEDNLKIEMGSPLEWFIHLSMELNIKTFPLSNVVARDILAFLPAGPERKYWHKLLTEFQMLLFQHHVNIKRQQEGKPLVNSVWLWGEGAISKDYHLINYRAIWNDSSFVRGIAYLSDTKIPLLDNKLFSAHEIHEPGEYLVIFNHFATGWLSLKNHFSVLLDRVYNGSIHRLTLYLGNGNSYIWKKRRKF